jgi:choloylglycine hydrolase
MAEATLAVDEPDAGMLAALHIVNAFDIPKGVVRSPEGGDFTAWSSVSDLSTGRYALRTYDDPTPRVVRLKDLDLKAAGPIRTVSMPSTPSFLPLSLADEQSASDGRMTVNSLETAVPARM